jgi:hypothetical protein
MRVSEKPAYTFRRVHLSSRHDQIRECHWLCQCQTYNDVNSQCTGVASGTQTESQAMAFH